MEFCRSSNGYDLPYPTLTQMKFQFKLRSFFNWRFRHARHTARHRAAALEFEGKKRRENQRCAISRASRTRIVGHQKNQSQGETEENEEEDGDDE